VERQVKERLVGAAVLMAAAIILIPEMLSGPDRESYAEQPVQARSDAPIKNYTIDLNQAPGAQPTPAVVENRAPPPEDSGAAQPSAAHPDPGDQAKPEVPQRSADPTPQPAATLPAPQPEPARTRPVEPVVEPPTVAGEAPPARPAQRPLASGAGAPTSGRWAVQVGSFSREATAERLVKQLREQGQTAFVMPVKSDGATLYRVRIGPLPDRASAAAALRDVKTLAPTAAIVSHP
jgi:DedD protein